MEGATAESLDASSRGARYYFRLAETSDDAALRKLLRETPMDGPVRVTLRREPCFFDSAHVDDEHQQTLCVIDNHTNQIVGMGARTLQIRYVDGIEVEVGYLSGLRILPAHRCGTLLARGYRELRRMHERQPTDFYVTTIAAGNDQAIGTLVGGRAGLPSYHPVGRYHTFIVPLCRGPRIFKNRDIRIRPLRNNELPVLVAFLQSAGRTKSLFPHYTTSDFQGPHATFKDLAIADILVAWQRDRIVGSLAIWNQSRFRQTVVEGYGPLIRYSRWAFNAWAKLIGWPEFPSIGCPINALTAGLTLVTDHDSNVFQQLLAAARYHGGQRYSDSSSLMIGMSANDPLHAICKRASLFQYVTNVYFVSWDEDSVWPACPSDRDIYLELGCL